MNKIIFSGVWAGHILCVVSVRKLKNKISRILRRLYFCVVSGRKEQGRLLDIWAGGIFVLLLGGPKPKFDYRKIELVNFCIVSGRKTKQNLIIEIWAGHIFCVVSVRKFKKIRFHGGYIIVLLLGGKNKIRLLDIWAGCIFVLFLGGKQTQN